MDAKQIILVGGGTRSGKSAFALRLTRRLGQRRLFLATAQAGDDEMRSRIAQHREERGADFDTIEEPLALPQAIRRASPHDVIVIDCLTLWLSNLLLASHSSGDILKQVDELIEELRRQRTHAIVITNEVGMGIVPESALGRQFRDLAGLAHQRLSRAADEVYVAILGTILRIKPVIAVVED